MEKPKRIDKLLIELGFAETIPKSQALVMAGLVIVNEKRVDKPSEEFPSEVKIRIKGQTAASRYVGRGGLKLEQALSAFQICPDKYVCLDIGASTGGFTDCLLQHGAEKVYTVDAGTNQLDWKLRNDARVEVRENVNARYLSPESFGEKFDLIVIDVSFISVTKILPVPALLLKDDGRLIILIKPQFEVRKGEVGKGGIVLDKAVHERVIGEVNNSAQENGFQFINITDSPILGAEGNKEFLALYEKSAGYE